MRVAAAMIGTFLVVLATMSLTVQYLYEHGVAIQGVIDYHGIHYFLAAALGSGSFTMLNNKQIQVLERQAIVAALFRICDPRSMENLKLGDTVQLKSGGPVMTLGNETGSRGVYQCAWFVGGELKHGAFPIEQLKKVEPPDEEPYIG